MENNIKSENQIENFNYLTANRAYNTFYLQLPKPFLTSPKYKSLSSNAKLAYTILRDRSEHSMLNNLVDDKGRIYFLFTDDELANDLSVSRNTARKTKKELIEVNLLKTVDMGYNKKKHQRNASRHYLAELEVNASDVYPIQEKHRENLENARNVDISHGANIAQELKRTYKELKEFKESPDDLNNFDENFLFKKSIENSEGNKELEQILIDEMIVSKNLKQTYGEQTIGLINAYSNRSLKTFENYINKLEFAMREIEKESGRMIDSVGNKFLHDELRKTFLQVVKKEKDGLIKTSFSGYLFESFKRTFNLFAL